MSARLALGAALAGLACLAASAGAAQSVTLHARFRPEQPGRSTAVGLEIDIHAAPGDAARSLSELTVRYPAGMDVALSGLGLAACDATRLEAVGLRACPTDSVMGGGSAITNIRLGGQTLRETARVTLVRAPEREGHMAMLLYVVGMQPIIVRSVLIGTMLPATAPFGGAIDIRVPPLASLSGADVEVERLSIVLGPPGLVYHERVHGRTVSYHPQGLLLPARCPVHGYPFSAELTFLEGAYASGAALVPCPRLRRGVGARRR